MTGPVIIIARKKWALVGESASDSLLVCGGERPIAIRVSHDDSQQLRDLIDDANAGIAAKAEAAAKGRAA